LKFETLLTLIRESREQEHQQLILFYYTEVYPNLATDPIIFLSQCNCANGLKCGRPTDREKLRRSILETILPIAPQYHATTPLRFHVHHEEQGEKHCYHWILGRLYILRAVLPTPLGGFRVRVRYVIDLTNFCQNPAGIGKTPYL
jgi:hypothetical protein